MARERVGFDSVGPGDLGPGEALRATEDARRVIIRRPIVRIFWEVFPWDHVFGEPGVEADVLEAKYGGIRGGMVADAMRGREPTLASLLSEISLVNLSIVAREEAEKWGKMYGRDEFADPERAKAEDVHARYWNNVSEVCDVASSKARVRDI